MENQSFYACNYLRTDFKREVQNKFKNSIIFSLLMTEF